jgi:hypothetical protein
VSQDAERPVTDARGPAAKEKKKWFRRIRRWWAAKTPEQRERFLRRIVVWGEAVPFVAVIAAIVVVLTVWAARGRLSPIATVASAVALGLAATIWSIFWYWWLRHKPPAPAKPTASGLPTLPPRARMLYRSAEAQAQDGPLPQSAEGTGLNPGQSGFESQGGHQRDDR